MDTEEPIDFYGKLTHQQQRFCDEYLTHFNAFKAAVNSGYSENTSRKGALLHVPKIQQYLKERMAERSRRLEITHDMILRELSKIAFSNMGNHYDEYACLKRMNELTVDEKAAIACYDIVEIQDGEGYRVGTQSKIKLHNKMSALDKIARHVGFYGILETKNQEARGRNQDVEKGYQVAGGESQKSKLKSQNDEGYQVAGIKYQDEGKGLGSVESEAIGRASFCEVVGDGGENTPLTPLERGSAAASVLASVVVDRSSADLPMDYPEEDFELEGIDLKTLAALEEVDVSPGSSLMIEGLNDGMIEGSEEQEAGSLKREAFLSSAENTPLAILEGGTHISENILTISPRRNSMTEGLNDRMFELQNDDFALRMGADTGPSTGSGQAHAAGLGVAVANACAV